MIELNRISGLDWDAGNERKNVEKHAVCRFEAEQVFFNEPLLVLEDIKHSDVEARYHALDYFKKIIYFVAEDSEPFRHRLIAHLVSIDNSE